MTANAYILQPTPTGGCMKKYSETPPALTKCSSEHSETSAAPAAMASEASEGFAAVAGKASERSETFAAPAAAASECSAAPAVTTGNSCSPHANLANLAEGASLRPRLSALPSVCSRTAHTSDSVCDLRDSRDSREIQSFVREDSGASALHADYADCHRKARAIAGADHPDGKRGRSDAQTSAKVCGVCVRQEKSA